MQAITTKFIPCTNFKPSRVKAECCAGSITLSWDHAENVEGNHDFAFKALVKKLGWRKEDGRRNHVWVKGTTKQGLDVYTLQADSTTLDV